jgi:hypothetical protein
MWAVSTVNDSVLRGRISKADKYFQPGARGLLYCRPTHSFTTPFIATSKADPRKTISDIWPEPWILPFSIDPLGGVHKQLHADIAKLTWPVLQRRCHGAGGVTAAMNITGVTVFVPVDITDEDWEIILRDLST